MSVSARTQSPTSATTTTTETPLTTTTTTATSSRELHVDRQTTSGLWPHPVFMRIERVLHFADNREVLS